MWYGKIICFPIVQKKEKGGKEGRKIQKAVDSQAQNFST
jgi:hypothetical protein